MQDLHEHEIVIAKYQSHMEIFEKLSFLEKWRFFFCLALFLQLKLIVGDVVVVPIQYRSNG